MNIFVGYTLKIIKIIIFILLTLIYLYYIVPTLFFYTKCSEPNLKYYYNIKNYKFENINYKSLLLEYNKYYNKELALDFFEDLTYNKNNKEDFHFKNIPLNINVNSINNNYLPLYNPLLSIGIVHSFFKNYTINFNCKTACQNKNIINTGNIGIRDFNNIQNTNKKSTRISSFIKKINNQIYQENKYNNLNSNINSTSKSKEYYSIFYRRNLKYLFRNYPISDIYLILQEEIQSCIYCCCTDNINSQKFNNRFLNSDSIPCSTFYNILRNQLEDIIIKLYLELILEENSENSEIFSIFKSVTTYKNQRELYINCFDAQVFLNYLLKYSTSSKLYSNSNNYNNNNNNNQFQKLVKFIQKPKLLLSQLKSLSDIFFFDNITDSNYKTPKMSDKQYTSKLIKFYLIYNM